MIRLSVLCLLVGSSLITAHVSAEKLAADLNMKTHDCVIYPSMVADLGSSVTGILTEVAVDRGDKVAKGKLIARLESSAEVVALELARIRAESTAELELRQLGEQFAERRQKRNEQLIKESLVAESTIDERETETRISQVQLTQAKENLAIAKMELHHATALLNRRIINSPFDGIVVERYKSVGELVEDKPVVRLAKLDPLHVEVIVPVDTIDHVKPGMHGKVALVSENQTSSDTHWIATISRIDPVADVASDTYGVRLTLSNPNGSIPAGRRCQVEFIDTVTSVDSDAKAKTESTKPTTSVSARETESASQAILQAAMPTVSSKRNTPGNTTPRQASKSTEPTRQRCQWVGPFPDTKNTEYIKGKLTSSGHRATVLEHTEMTRRGTNVFTTRQSDRYEAETLLSRLHSAGFKAAYLSKNKAVTQVALGAFEKKDNAIALRDSVARQGIGVEMHPWNVSSSNYYLAVSLSESQTTLDVFPDLPVLTETIKLRNSDGSVREADCAAHVLQ